MSGQARWAVWGKGGGGKSGEWGERCEGGRERGGGGEGCVREGGRGVG